MAKEAYGLNRSHLQKEGILPSQEQLEGKDTYLPISDWKQLYHVIHFSQRKGSYRERFGEHGAENDPTFQQMVVYGFVTNGDKFLVYQRGAEGSYDESRLAGKLSLGIGGHMERTDSNLVKSFYREFGEEVQVLTNGSPVPTEDIKQYVSIAPVGLIKDERDDVGKVHLGVVCQVKPKSDDIDIQVKSEAGEGVNAKYVTKEELQQILEQGEAVLEGWSDIVFRNEILPRSS